MTSIARTVSPAASLSPKSVITMGTVVVALGTALTLPTFLNNDIPLATSLAAPKTQLFDQFGPFLPPIKSGYLA